MFGDFTKRLPYIALLNVGAFVKFPKLPSAAPTHELHAVPKVYADLGRAVGSVVAKSSNYTILAGDRNTLFSCTGSFTLDVTAAATLGNGWFCSIRNDGTGIITIDPNGAETIDGKTTIRVYQGESFFLTSNGANLKTVGRAKGLILLASQSASNSTSIDFGNLFTDPEMVNYKALPYDVVPGTTDTGMRIRLSDDGGSTFKQGGSDYIGYVSDGATPSNVGSADAIYTSITTANTQISSASGNGAAFNIDFFNPAGTALEKMVRGQGIWEDANSSSTRCWEFAGKYQGATAAITGVRFYMSSGNIASGVFPIYGVRQ